MSKPVFAVENDGNLVIGLAICMSMIVGLKPLAIVPFFVPALAFALFAQCCALFYLLRQGVSFTNVYAALVLAFTAWFFMLPGDRGDFGLPLLPMLAGIVIVLSPVTAIHNAISMVRITVAVACLPGLFQYLVYVLSGTLIGSKIEWFTGSEIHPGFQFFFNYVRADLVYSQFSIPVFRFQGIFDEPGLMGTFSALLLAHDRFRLRKPLNLTLAIYGVTSLSLAFVAIATIYAALALIFLPRKIYPLAFFAVTITLAFNLWQFADDVPLFSRLASVETLQDLNNRSSNSFDLAFERHLQTANTTSLLRGQGSAAHTQLNAGASSWKVIVYNYGVAGILLYLILLFLIYQSGDGALLKTPHRILVLICILASFFQRPEIIAPFYFGLITLHLKQGIRPDTTVSADSRT